MGGTWLCAAPIGADLRAYRRRHHLHHRHTRQPDDPDLGLSTAFPLSRGRLALVLTGDLCGWTALTRLLLWRPWRAGRRALSPLIANAVLGAALTALGGIQLYLLAWLLPWATWYQLATRVRDIAEHGMVPSAEDPLRNTRTIRAGLLARLALAPYWVNHHLEHHLLVFVPCWKLRQVQALLIGKQLGERMERAASYSEVMRRATLGLLLGILLLPACAGVPVPPAYTEEELATRCWRTGGWWRPSSPGSLIAGNCEYKD